MDAMNAMRGLAGNDGSAHTPWKIYAGQENFIFHIQQPNEHLVKQRRYGFEITGGRLCG